MSLKAPFQLSRSYTGSCSDKFSTSLFLSRLSPGTMHFLSNGGQGIPCQKYKLGSNSMGVVAFKKPQLECASCHSEGGSASKGSRNARRYTMVDDVRHNVFIGASDDEKNIERIISHIKLVL